MKKYCIRRFFFFISFFMIFLASVHGDIFYTPNQYNSVYNDKVATVMELKLLKRQYQNEKENLESKNRGLQTKIDGLEQNIDILRKQMAESLGVSEKRIGELEKRTNILTKKGSDRENQLIEENRNLQKRFEKDIEDLQKKLNKEREDNSLAQKQMREQNDAKAIDLNRTIANLNNELSDLKQLNKKQRDEMTRMKSQAEELENQLKDEIQNKEITIKRYHNKLIINIDEKISFDSGSSDLKKEIFPALNKINIILTKYSENKIIVEGHTDSVPIRSKKFRDNWQLSTERALSVLQFLLKNKELDARRFSASGYGEFNPIFSNDTDANRALNRRVDIVILPQAKE